MSQASASSLEICFPKYKTSAIRDTMGSQFRLAAAVTWPSLEGKEEECGSSQSTKLSIAASPWHSGQGAAVFQRAQGRVAGAAGCTGAHGRLPGNAGSWALSLGAMGQRERRCVPGSLPSWCHHSGSFSSPSLPCFGFLWFSTQQLPLVHSHRMWSLHGISAGCKREDWALFPGHGLAMDSLT